MRRPTFVLLEINTLWLFFINLFFSFFLQAQAPYFQKIGADQGLPTSTVYDLFSSKEGHLYLGVETGLARFNGTNFNLYPIVGNRSRSVNAIQQSEDGTIWCMNFTNQLFYLDKDTLRAAIKINKAVDQSGPLRDFVLDNKGIYFLTEKQLFLQRKNGVIVKVLDIDDTISNNSFIEVIKCSDGLGLYVLDGKFSYRLNQNHEIIERKLLKKGQNTGIIFNGELVTAPKANLKALRIGQNTPSFKKNGFDSYLNHLAVIDDELWLCTNSGLMPLNNENNTFDKLFFENTRVTDIVKDFEGGYWVSSVDRGLFYIPNKNLNQIRFSDYNVYRVCKGPKNSFFIGTGNGEICHFSADGSLINQLKTNYISEVEFMLFDSDENRLITSHGLFSLSNNYNYLPIRIGKSIAKDNKGNFLLNTYNQAIILNNNLRDEPNIPYNERGEVAFGSYSNYKIPFLALYKNRSNSGYFDVQSNSFYIGTYDALRKINYNGEEKVISFEGSNIIVLSITKSKKGDYILCTQKNGLLRMQNDKVEQLYDTKNGLNSNTCIKTIEKEHLLFVLTDLGLNMINTQTNRITNISANLSLKNINIFDFTIISKKLFLATDIGLLHIGIPEESLPIFPKLNNLSLFRAKEAIPLIETQFAHHDNNLRFIADAVHFQNNGQYTFEYRLTGLDEDWQEQSSKNNTFSFLSIPSGEYTFELKMKINEVYSEMYSKSFIIKSPYWQTPWFFILAFGLTIFLSFLFFRRVLLQQRKKQLIKQRLLQSQMVSLRSQMNPHFLFNIVNSVQGLIYANKKTEASNLLGKMSMLMRRVLEVSDKPKISIHKELDILKNYVELEAARFEEDFKYSIKTNIPIEDQETLIPSLIIQPFIENAIKHGLMHKTGPKTLMIELNKKGDEWIEIIIEDNGIGREASQRINAKRVNHQSFASEAIESRITLINKANGENNITLKTEDLVDENKQAKGTRITIKINIHE